MQFVVLAGGLGSRAQEVCPKVLRKIGDQTLLERYLVEIANTKLPDKDSSILFLLGHKSKEIIEALNEKPPFSTNTKVFVEEKRLGTYGALFQARDLLEKEFVLILGDLYFQFDFTKFIEYSRARKARMVFVVHPNGHSFDSDVAKLDPLTNKILDVKLKKDDSKEVYSVLSLAGIHYFKDIGKLFDYSVETPTDLIEFMTQRYPDWLNDSYGYVTSEFIKDAGTPERVNEIVQAISNRSILRRSNLSPKSVIFIDRDDTLIPDVNSEHVIKKRISEEVSKCNLFGVPIFVISNQPSVAKGVETLSEVQIKNYNIDRQLESCKAFFDAWYWCPHHPDKNFIEETRAFKVKCECRKPSPGLLMFAARDHSIELDSSYMIGDSDNDFFASTSVGVTFLHTREFVPCNFQRSHNCFEKTSEAISFARNEILRKC